MAVMSDVPVLVGSDLLVASRLRAALRGAVTQVADTATVPQAPVVFVDLNEHIERRLDVIRALHAAGQAHIIGFCRHEDRATRVAGKQAGAEEVVTNGYLPETALRVTSAA